MKTKSQTKKNKPVHAELTTIFADLIAALGEDLNREGLQKTPERAAAAYAYLTGGYNLNLKNVVNDAVFTCKNKDLVVVKDIEFFSTCEHHLLPIIGSCHIAYIPDGKVLGLSKLARIVDMYAHRLQIQENLTKQIADAIMKSIKAKAVMVVVDAIHLCMMARGVKKQMSSVRTFATIGETKTVSKIRREVLTMLDNGAESYEQATD